MATTLYPPPDPSAVYWRRQKTNGNFEYASIQSMVKDDHGNWKALFLVPGQAAYYVNQHDGELRNWEPIFALTEENLETIIERIAQRVTAILTDKGIEAQDIVPAAMEVVQKETIQDAIEAAVEATVEEDFEAAEARVTKADEPDYFVTESFDVLKKQFTCGVCDKKYAYVKSLRKHIAKEHNILDEQITENAQ